MNPLGTIVTLFAGFVLGNDSLRSSVLKVVQDLNSQDTKETEVKDESHDV